MSKGHHRQGGKTMLIKVRNHDQRNPCIKYDFSNDNTISFVTRYLHYMLSILYNIWPT